MAQPASLAGGGENASVLALTGPRAARQKVAHLTQTGADGGVSTGDYSDYHSDSSGKDRSTWKFSAGSGSKRIEFDKEKFGRKMSEIRAALQSGTSVVEKIDDKVIEKSRCPDPESTLVFSRYCSWAREKDIHGFVAFVANPTTCRVGAGRGESAKAAAEMACGGDCSLHDVDGAKCLGSNAKYFQSQGFPYGVLLGKRPLGNLGKPAGIS